jgi:hypothetical protein
MKAWSNALEMRSKTEASHIHRKLYHAACNLTAHEYSALLEMSVIHTASVSLVKHFIASGANHPVQLNKALIGACVADARTHPSCVCVWCM